MADVSAEIPLRPAGPSADDASSSTGSDLLDRAQDDDSLLGHGGAPRVRGHVGVAGRPSSIANLSNTILGAGILAMPHALRSDGILLGLVVIVWSGLTSGTGLYLQYRCARYVERGGASFFNLSLMTYPSLSVVFDAAIAIKCFGVGVSYLIIIGDLMPQVVLDVLPDLAGTGAAVLDRRLWVSFFMVVLVPLCFLRRMDSLKYTSVVALVAIGYLVLLVLGHFFVGDLAELRGPISLLPQSTSAVLTSFPVVVFGFTCHQNMFSIVNELRDNSASSVVSVITSSIGSAIVLYTAVGMAGYLSFGDAVSGNIISMYPRSLTSAIGRVAIVVLVLFSYPLQCHPCRNSLASILHLRPMQRIERALAARAAGVPVAVSAMSQTRFVTITTLIMVLSYIVAMTVTSLETVLSFVGATGSTSISFILPGVFAYKLLGSPYHVPVLDDTPDPADQTEPAPARDGQTIRTVSLALACWGGFVMVVCLSANIWHVLQ
ncbi:transmembrane amino acid transporter protein-domain-containing protein [Dipodascopsis tothii]|uniref:transmembrane amino acid transporter protein-domain-containing protein n=1 Tax=Dipodascopsis tothii TaxID=44089 RepID=UPI0034CE2B80